ncbi:unnamed protein product [Alopecurus aequalis]
MNTMRRTAAILLVLSLGALVAGRLSAWVPDHDGVDTILLPSHGLAHELVREEATPPTCCELARCTRSFPPTCWCVDQVKECAATCKSCEKVDEASSLYVCRDSYTGYPDPMCAKSVTTGPPRVAGHEATATEADATPCCDLPRCTRSFPTSCQCMDRMNKCPKTCKLCEKDEASSLIVCLDLYSKIGPACTPAAPPPPPAEQERPWECCDLARCTRSFPPTCQCMDKVKKCAKACKSCQKVEGSSRYVCEDQYRGKQGPACTSGAPPPPTFTPRAYKLAPPDMP